jgi:glycosyltransferase involved in cell wall biosynthesis
LEVVHALEAEAFSEVGLRICTYGPAGSPEFVAKLNEAINESVSTILWYRGLSTPSFHSLLRNSSLYVRNTSSDTFGLTLSEAQELGTAAIATDVCERPLGVRTYPCGQHYELVQTLHEELNGPRESVSTLLAEQEAERSLNAIIAAYQGT